MADEKSNASIDEASMNGNTLNVKITQDVNVNSTIKNQVSNENIVQAIKDVNKTLGDQQQTKVESKPQEGVSDEKLAALKAISQTLGSLLKATENIESVFIEKNNNTDESKSSEGSKTVQKELKEELHGTRFRTEFGMSISKGISDALISDEVTKKLKEVISESFTENKDESAIIEDSEKTVTIPKQQEDGTITEEQKATESIQNVAQNVENSQETEQNVFETTNLVTSSKEEISEASKTLINTESSDEEQNEIGKDLKELETAAEETGSSEITDKIDSDIEKDNNSSAEVEKESKDMMAVMIAGIDETIKIGGTDLKSLADMVMQISSEKLGRDSDKTKEQLNAESEKEAENLNKNDKPVEKEVKTQLKEKEKPGIIGNIKRMIPFIGNKSEKKDTKKAEGKKSGFMSILAGFKSLKGKMTNLFKPKKADKNDKKEGDSKIDKDFKTRVLEWAQKNPDRVQKMRKFCCICCKDTEETFLEM